MRTLDLTDRLGFEADLNLQTGEISFGEAKPTVVQQRTLKDMYRVLAQTNPLISPGLEGILSLENNGALVHRLLRFIGDTPEIVEAGLKLDITVIHPTPHFGITPSGIELPKTTGHYHLPLLDGTQTPDFYQIVYGQGVIMLQREDVPDIGAFVVRPELMQHVLIPPWMGHLTVNTGKKPLVFVNICVREPHLNYGPYLDRHGGAYYLVSQDGRETFIPNQAYKKNTPMQELVPNGVPGLESLNGMPFYPILRDRLPELKFLKHPSKQLYVFEQCLKPKKS